MKTKTLTNNEIVPGTILLSEKPFVAALKGSLRTERCSFCFKKTKLMRCASCQYVQYCGVACQRSGWEDHKMECGFLKKSWPRIVPDAARFIALIIFKLKRGGDQVKGYYTPNKFRKFKDLMSHYSDLKEDKLRLEHFTSLCAVLIDYIGASNLPNTAELLGIYGRVCVNGFNILDSEMYGIGTGIYLAASVIDHSCDPNAVAVFEGTTLHIRALKHMPSLDWTKIRITYIELLNHTTVRQAELLKTYYFICDCKLCASSENLDISDSMLCPNPECSESISIHYLKTVENYCQSCGNEISAERIEQYESVAEFSRKNIDDMKDVSYLDICEVCINKQNGLFHPLNILHVKFLDMAFESCISMKLFSSAKEYCVRLNPGLKYYYGPCHPLYGIFLMKYGKICHYLNLVEEAYNHLKEAEKILSVTHGKSHDLYKNELIPLLSSCATELSS